MNNLITTATETSIEWQDIPGFEGSYQASKTGLIRTIKKTKYKSPGDLISQHVNKASGYVTVHLGTVKSSLYVHRLVMAAFEGACPAGKVVNHKDGNRRNNHFSNLEYVTQKENIEHSIHTLGAQLGAIGTNHRDAKLTPDSVRLVRQAITAGESLNSIGRRFGVSPAAILQIKRGQTWRHVT
jgi:hypothetical protein